MAPRIDQSCLNRIARAGRIGTDRALEILEEISNRADREQMYGRPNPIYRATADLARKILENEKRNALSVYRNTLKRMSMTNALDNGGGIKNAFQTVSSWLDFTPGAARNDSVRSLGNGLQRAWVGVLWNKIRGLEKVAVSGLIDKEYAEGIWRARGGTPDPKIKISGVAQRLVDATMPLLEQTKDRLNSVGANILDATHYVTHTNWDPRQLRRAAGPGATAEQAFEAWWAKDRPRMAEYTFRDVKPGPGQSMADAEKELGRSVFFSRITGMGMEDMGGVGMAEAMPGYVAPAYEGTRNLAKAVSQHKVIGWKSSSDWLDHMRDFGGGQSLFAQVNHTLGSAARHYALMDKFADNPAGNLNKVLEDYMTKHRDTDPDAVLALQKRVPRLQQMMGRLDGSLNIPLNADRQQTIENALTVEATAHLGGVSATHVAGALATVPGELAHHGFSHLNSLGKVLGVILKGKGSEETRKIMSEAGGYVHGAEAYLKSQWQPDHGLPGFMSWMAGNFIRLTTLPHWIDQFQTRAVKQTLLANLGHQADKAFGEIEPHVLSMLQRYGINDRDWDLIRNAPDPVTVEGIRYITPGDVNRLSDGTLRPTLESVGEIPPGAPAEDLARAARDFRWQLGDKFLMYANDAAERATVTPGPRERAIALGSSRPGEWNYIFRRMFWQFKMWPLASWNQQIMRDISFSLSNKEMATNLGWLLALSTAAGALRMTVNDYASGNPQRDYSNPVTLMAALAQGGGTGILGDFMFGETSRMGAGLVATAGGPIAADADRLLQIYNRFRSDEEHHDKHAIQHIWPDLARFGVGHIPFANLIYLKGVLDYLAFYHIYEAASPGWWERTNRRLLREQGRTMTGYVPGQGVPFTPWGLGSGAATGVH